MMNMPMTANVVQRYKQTEIATQNKGKIVVMLYDGAIKFLRLAEQKITEGDHVAKGRYISKAQAIIMELNVALDMEQGKEIAKTLRSLYDFMIRHLNKANVERDPHLVRQVVSQLERLSEGWRAITT